MATPSPLPNPETDSSTGCLGDSTQRALIGQPQLLGRSEARGSCLRVHVCACAGSRVCRRVCEH